MRTVQEIKDLERARELGLHPVYVHSRHLALHVRVSYMHPEIPSQREAVVRVASSFGSYTPVYRALGWRPAAKGGMTTCALLDEGDMSRALAYALCNPEDNFCRATSRTLALRRALDLYRHAQRGEFPDGEGGWTRCEMGLLQREGGWTGEPSSGEDWKTFQKDPEPTSLDAARQADAYQQVFDREVH